MTKFAIAQVQTDALKNKKTVNLKEVPQVFDYLMQIAFIPDENANNTNQIADENNLIFNLSAINFCDESRYKCTDGLHDTPQHILELAAKNGFLKEQVMRQSDISGANLSDCDLKKIYLGGATAVGTGFQRAILTDANLTQAVLREAVLAEADLNNANVDGTDLWGSDISDAKLESICNLPKAKNLCFAFYLDSKKPDKLDDVLIDLGLSEKPMALTQHEYKTLWAKSKHEKRTYINMLRKKCNKCNIDYRKDEERKNQNRSLETDRRPKIHSTANNALFFITCAASATFLTGMLAPKNTMPQNVANASGVVALLAGATLCKKQQKYLDSNRLIKKIFENKKNPIEIGDLIHEINSYRTRYQNDAGFLSSFNGMAARNIFNIADLTPNSFYSVDTIDFLSQFKLYKELPDSSNTKFNALTQLNSMHSQSGFFKCLAYRSYLGNEMALIAINDPLLKDVIGDALRDLFQNSLIKKNEFHNNNKDLSSLLGRDTVTQITKENNAGINNLFQNSDIIKIFMQNSFDVDQNTFEEMMKNSDHSKWQEVFNKIATAGNTCSNFEERFDQLKERSNNDDLLPPVIEAPMVALASIAAAHQEASQPSR